MKCCNLKREAGAGAGAAGGGLKICHNVIFSAFNWKILGIKDNQHYEKKKEKKNVKKHWNLKGGAGAGAGGGLKEIRNMIFLASYWELNRIKKYQN